MSTKPEEKSVFGLKKLGFSSKSLGKSDSQFEREKKEQIEDTSKSSNIYAQTREVKL